MTEGKDFSAGLRTVKHQRFRSEGKRYVMQGADGIKIGTKAVWRRLPSLLYREFPNPLRAREFRDVRKFQCPADLEIGDTAGLENPRYAARALDKNKTAAARFRSAAACQNCIQEAHRHAPIRAQPRTTTREFAGRF